MPRPNGGYKIDGNKIPGVTTIIGRFKDSGPLLFWAFEQGKATQRGEINALYDKRDEAANAGTLAHSMVQAHVLGEPEPDTLGYSDEIIKLARQGYENYLEWESNSSIKIVFQEKELLSQTHLFGGCLDAIGRDSKGRYCILDWKTSNGIYPDYLLQLAAYNQLWNENYPEMPIDGGFHLCRFAKEHADFAHHYWSELDEAWEQFMLFRKAYDLDKKLKKRV